jgi:hypothetical protein
MKSAQIIWEYLFIVALGFLLVIIFASQISTEISVTSEEREIILLKDLARVIQNEIYLASEVETGYIRYFDVPADLDGDEYIVENSANKLILRKGEYDFSVTIPNVMGSITKGSNRITNLNSLICIGNITCDDTLAPVVVASSPSGTIAFYPVTLSVDTDEDSTCKYSTEDINYFSMADFFEGTSTAHLANINLGNGTYTYYARCNDKSGNSMTGSEVISFTVLLT